MSQASLNLEDALMPYQCASGTRSFEHQAVERQSRKNRDLAIQVKRHATSAGSDQFAIARPVALDRGIAQKGPMSYRFIGQRAPARFFPGQFFVEEKNFASSLRQFRRG